MIRNLTLEEINIWDGDQLQIRIPAEGQVRDSHNAISGEVVVDTIEGIPVVEVILGKVDLPEPQEGTSLIVTRVVAEAAAAQGRTTSDLLLCSSSSAVRDHEGNEIGCRQLARLTR